jgi:hypothetical protein
VPIAVSMHWLWVLSPQPVAHSRDREGGLETAIPIAHRRGHPTPPATTRSAAHHGLREGACDHARTTRAAPADQRAEIDTMSEVMRRARSAAGPARRVFRISRRDSSLGARQAGRLGGAGRARRECRRPETSERTCQISFANLSALSRRIEERLDTCHTSCQSMPCVARFIGTGRSPRVGPRTSAGESRQHSHRRLQT